MLLKEISKAVNGELIGDPNYQINNIATIYEAKENHLSFILEKKYLKYLNKTNAKAFITFKKIADLENQIIVKNPRKALAKAISIFYFSQENKVKPIISKNSSLGKNVSLASSVTIADFVYIMEGSSVGKNTVIKANVTIGKNCTIGNNCLIYPNVVIYDNTQIGNNVILHAGAVIGSDGFGYYEDNGCWNKIPHIGKVIIQDDVEIGSNTSIDRGCLGNTSIGKGTKIDNLSHIAHNTVIGENCAIAAQFGSLGGGKINNHVQIGGQVGIADIVIDDNAIIAGRAGVTKDVPKNAIFSGFPAWGHVNELKKEAILRKMVKN